MWVYDLETLAFLAVNEAAMSVYGYSQDEFLRMTAKDIRPSEEVGAFVADAARVHTGFENSGVWTHRRKDGSEFSVEIISNELEFAGRPARLVSVTDITELKRAEEKLQTREHEIGEAQSIAHIGSWTWDLATNSIKWSAEMYRIYGFAPESFIPTLESLAKCVHPDDAERREKNMRDMTSGQPFRPYTYRLIPPGGTVRTVQVMGMAVERDAKGNPFRLTGLVQDVTDRRNAEEKLAQLASIVESSSDAIIGKTLTGTITSWNAGAARLYGYSASEVVGRPINILVPPELQDEVPAIIERMRRGEVVEHYETVRVRKGGQRIEVSVTVSPMRDANGKIVGASAIARDITERKKLEERFSKAFNASPVPMTISTLEDGRFIDANESYLRITGYRRDEMIGQTSEELKFWSSETDRARLRSVIDQEGSIRDMEIKFLTKSGEPRTGLLSAEIIDVGNRKCVLAVTKDITEQKLLENQLRQAQKMEAIGQLSGGIAHDFNNLLGVILGYGEDLELRLGGDPALQKKATQIRKAGERAAALTRQLLAFSRQQVLNLRSINLNEVVTDIEKMLRRLIGEDIDLSAKLDLDLGRVKVDQSQLEQVIVNLAVNARDAMPDGGKLSIETANVELDDTYARRHPPLRAGPHILLAVTDTGTGMDAATQAHIFEPFFTTKELGKGTGLGLATVYGIVKQSEGYIWVYSEIGRGTTFKIYLPRIDERVPTEVEVANAPPVARGTVTILLVEDEEALRVFTRELLEEHGYKILEAENAERALEIARSFPGAIHLLLSDVVMPGMSGQELAAVLAQSRPDLKVLLTSGYTGHAAVRRGLLDPTTDILQKPFARQILLRRVHDVLQKKLPTN